MMYYTLFISPVSYYNYLYVYFISIINYIALYKR
nr:MAG TPA: hypothetical protein [Caudoviricetes sp.]